MQGFTTISLFLLLRPYHALADGVADFSSLQTLIQTTSNQILQSVVQPNVTNSTYMRATSFPFPTDVKIQAIENALLTSQSEYENNRTGFISNRTNDALDQAYMTYVDEVPSLAQALTARGRAWHADWNWLVYQNLQGLVSAINQYSYVLARANIISDPSVIRTITAVNILTDAENDWSYEGNLPGNMR